MFTKFASFSKILRISSGAEVSEKAGLSMGLTSYRFLDQLPVLHVIGQRKAEIRTPSAALFAFSAVMY